MCYKYFCLVTFFPYIQMSKIKIDSSFHDQIRSNLNVSALTSNRFIPGSLRFKAKIVNCLLLENAGIWDSYLLKIKLMI